MREYLYRLANGEELRLRADFSVDSEAVWYQAADGAWKATPFTVAGVERDVWQMVRAVGVWLRKQNLHPEQQYAGVRYLGVMEL